MTTLRSSILYIHSLRSLLEDCERGRVEQEVLDTCRLDNVKTRRGKGKQKRKKRGEKITEKQQQWKNYSHQEMERKFGKKQDLVQSPSSPAMLSSYPTVFQARDQGCLSHFSYPRGTSFSSLSSPDSSSSSSCLEMPEISMTISLVEQTRNPDTTVYIHNNALS